ncbi:MAG: ABC transporter ATP-binding protein [Actinomycetota bacterium]
MSKDSITSISERATALSLIDVSKSFNTTDGKILDGINLTVAKGEFISIVGASGCGKSTLLSIICGIDKKFEGRVDNTLPTTLMFQDSALLPWLSVVANVELPMRLQGRPKAERESIARDLLVRMDLGNAINKRPHELSGGMRQRVAIARALAQESKVLLMDEPFGALDAITRDVLHDELSTVWSENSLSIVFVTHNVREAVRLGERVILMGSRPGTFIKEWAIDMPEPRRIDTAEVAEMARENHR